jgi:acetyl esterase
MPVAPEIAALLPGINAQPQMHQRPLAALRQTRDRIDPSSHQPVGSVRDLDVPTRAGHVKARLYGPADAPAGLPFLMMIHGGGFVFGDLEGYYDHICRVLCVHGHCRVLSVNYRLAPEHKFPAAGQDVHDALGWARANAGTIGIDLARMVIGGGSAGANLATATALRVRDAGEPPLRGQLLFYPIVDWHSPPSESLTAFAEGYYLTRADVEWFWRQYLRGDADRHDPYAVPLVAADLSGLPPALVVTAEFDPLRDGAERYARRMEEAGVPVRVTRYPGMVHGFLAFPTARADEALEEAAGWLRQLFAG